MKHDCIMEKNNYTFRCMFNIAHPRHTATEHRILIEPKFNFNRAEMKIAGVEASVFKIRLRFLHRKGFEFQSRRPRDLSARDLSCIPRSRILKITNLWLSRPEG